MFHDDYPAPKGSLDNPIVAEGLALAKAHMERIRKKVLESSRVGGSEGGTAGGATGSSYSSNQQEP